MLSVVWGQAESMFLGHGHSLIFGSRVNAPPFGEKLIVIIHTFREKRKGDSWASYFSLPIVNNKETEAYAILLNEEPLIYRIHKTVFKHKWNGLQLKSQRKWHYFLSTFPVTSFIPQSGIQKNSSILYGILLP